MVTEIKMNRTQIIFIFLTALLLFILHQTFLILLPFLKPFFWASVIAFTFYPTYEKLRKTTSWNENLSSMVVTLSIFFIFAPFTIFIIYNLIQEAFLLYNWLKNYIENNQLEVLISHIRSFKIIQRVESILHWDIIEENFKEWILNSANMVGRFTAKQVAIFTKNILFGIVNFFLTFFLIFFAFRDGKKIYDFFYRVIPLDEETKKEIFEHITETFSAVIRGQIVTAIVQSAIAGLVFWALGLPLPIFFAALSFLVSLVPVLGAAAVWVPFTIYLFMIGSTTKALILLFLGTFVISLADNFLKPLLIGRKIKLPYLLLFLGILGGLQVYGMVGVFVAPIVLSLLFVLIRAYREKFIQEQG